MDRPNTETKIKPTHLNREAIIYIRQSTLHQVRENTESTKQQYQLKERAISLGWDPVQVTLIDEDLGQSATRSDNRFGFQKLVARVGLAQVGAVFGLEVSRLARSCSDWYRLLELCAISDTLIVDADGIYNPNLYNDRLVLGLKGTLSEAEIHILKSRLYGGKLVAAKEGRLRFPLPMGYIWNEADKIVWDPNQRVADAIKLLFSTFETVGSAYKVVRDFAQNQILFPKRDFRGIWAKEIQWGPLTHSRVLSVLHNPTYAGAYTFGKSTQQASKKADKPNTGHTIGLPMTEWEVLIFDHHPAYITWETYQKNLAILSANRTNAVSSPLREGVALLQGIAICGSCGRKLKVRYTGNGGYYITYECNYARIHYGQSRSCPTFSGAYLEEAVCQIFLSALSQSNLAISIKAFEKIAEKKQLIDHQWQQRIESAQYSAQLAERRYLACEPENRLVARTLESQWNEELQQLSVVKADYQKSQNQHQPRLTDLDREQLLKLAEDLPTVWSSPTTGSREKKRLLRTIIEDVTLTKQVELRQTRVTIHWKSGFTTEHLIQNPLPAYEKRKTKPETVSLISKLAEQHADSEIATILNARGIDSPTGGSFTSSKVRHIRYSRSIVSHKKFQPSLTDTGPRVDGSYCARQLAEILEVDRSTILNWAKQGIITGTQAAPKSPWWFQLSEPELSTLKQMAQNRRRKNSKPFSEEGF